MGLLWYNKGSTAEVLYFCKRKRGKGDYSLFPRFCVICGIYCTHRKERIKMESKEEKMFTQEEVNAIVRERLERERSRYNGDADALAALQQEVTQLREDLQKATAEAAEKEKAYKAEKINTGVLNTLTSANLVAPSQMLRMFVMDVDLNDDGDLTIKHEGKDLPFNEYIESWARQNPWAVKNTQKPGSGGPDLSLGGTAVSSAERMRDLFVRKE